MVRDGLVRLISQQTDLTCCGESSTAGETLDAVNRHKPDLVILDLRLKAQDGLELIKSLKSQQPHLRILVLSQYGAPIYIERAMRAGASGYVVKEQAADEVLSAIRAVLAGEIYLTRGMAGLLLKKLLVPKTGLPHHPSAEPLTDRELHVLQLLGSGLSTREIASELNLSFKTIETHRENIKRKLGLRDASALVHFATEWAREQITLPGVTDDPGQKP